MNTEGGSNENGVQESNGKRRKTVHHVEETNDEEDSNEAAPVVFDNDDVFNAVLDWLSAADVSRCCQVCKVWNNNITQQTWKQVAKAKSSVGYKSLCDALQERNDSGALDAKAIAIGLSRVPPSEGPTIQHIPKPTLKPSDVFLHLEVSIDVPNNCQDQSQSSHSQKFSWCQSLQECCASFDDDRDDLFPSLVFLNAIGRKYPSWGNSRRDNKIDEPIKIDDFAHLPMASSKDSSPRLLQIGPEAFFAGIEVLLDNMQITLRLFRADNGKSVLLRNDSSFEDVLTSEDPLGAAGSYVVCEDLKPMASTQEGTAAREMCFHQGYNYLSVDADIMLAPILPEGTPDEPGWAQSLRGRDGLLSPSDYDGFSKTKFEYQFVSITSDFRFSVGTGAANDNVDSVDHFMLFLEGLEWN